MLFDLAALDRDDGAGTDHRLLTGCSLRAAAKHELVLACDPSDHVGGVVVRTLIRIWRAARKAEIERHKREPARDANGRSCDPSAATQLRQ